MSTSSAVNYLRELVARPWSQRTASTIVYMACHEALHTIELLENILFNLSTQDLLRAQRVCHHWRSTIENSSPLQENLFFKPVASKITWLAEVSGVYCTFANDYTNENSSDHEPALGPRSTPATIRLKSAPLRYCRNQLTRTQLPPRSNSHAR